MNFAEREFVWQLSLMLCGFILAALLVFITFKGLGNRDKWRRELNTGHCQLLCEYAGDRYIGDSDAYGCWCAHNDGEHWQLRQIAGPTDGC